MMSCMQSAESVKGEFVRKLALLVSADYNCGLAVSPDSRHLALTLSNHAMSVYAMPDMTLLTTFGARGAGPGQFSTPAKLCFSPLTGNVLVAELGNKRVQEVTLTGEHVRFIGVGEFEHEIRSIAANTELLLVGKYQTEGGVLQLSMFDLVSGALLRHFGACGDEPGQLLLNCNAIKFTPDNRHIVVAESTGNGQGRLSLFTLAGEFVKSFGAGSVKGAYDIAFAGNDNMLVADYTDDRIVEFSPDGDSVVRTWKGRGEGFMTSPSSVALFQHQLLVLAFNKVVIFE